MNERLVEDWLSKASERSYQTPFAQALLATGAQVLRVGHGPHEHGKDVIAINEQRRVNAYQLKAGDLDLQQWEKGYSQIVALVETQLEHPAIASTPKHHPWLVISGKTSMPVEDRIRTQNAAWKKRGYKPLRTINGPQLLQMFARMASNFWPQMPEDSNRLFNLFLADGEANLDRNALARMVLNTAASREGAPKAEAVRRLAAANLFASYALSPFYKSQNHWELVQGWTITAAQIAWSATKAKLPRKVWYSTFRLAVDAALTSLSALVNEATQPESLGPRGFELDELTRSRCTICAGAIAAKVLIDLHRGVPRERSVVAQGALERLVRDGRVVVWGESAVPPLLAVMWALDNLRGDQLSDTILLGILARVVRQNSSLRAPKLPPPHDSADEANSKALLRLFEKHKAMEVQAAASYTLESLVTIAARRLWRNFLAALWSPITKTSMVRLVPDNPADMLLWHWGYERGSNQDRLFPAPQSWRKLLEDSRRDECQSLPAILRDEFEFAVIFLLCFPHRLTVPLAKYFEQYTSSL